MAIVSDTSPVRNEYTLGGDAMSLLVSVIALPVIVLLGYQRSPRVINQCTVATTLCFLCYVTNFLFIWIVTVLGHVRWPLTESLCNVMVTACVVGHNIARGAEYAFFIERVYIISWPSSRRIKNIEYILTTCWIFGPYIGITVLSACNLIAHVNEHEVCISGTERFALLPMLCVEVFVQLYLTLRFLFPLLAVHRRGNGLMLPLRKVAIHAAIGSAITLVGDIAVKASLALFNGESIWVCYTTCKLETLLDAFILHWITKPILNEEASDNGQPALADHGVTSDTVATPAAVLSTNDKCEITTADFALHLGNRELISGSSKAV